MNLSPLTQDFIIIHNSPQIGKFKMRSIVKKNGYSLFQLRFFVEIDRIL